MAVVALALCIKTVVPQGYMIGMADGFLTIEMCIDMPGGAAMDHAMIGDMDHDMSGPDMSDHADMAGGKQMGGDKPCAFSALSMGALDTATVFLAAALIFAFQRALLPRVVRPLVERRWLLPPLRGPPITL